MSTKYSSMNTDLTEMKMITVKGKIKDQFKNLETVDAKSNTYNDIDASSTLSTLTTITSPLKKPLKDISLTENATPKLKRNHKHKHHHHHHNCKHHNHRHHHHHHHTRRHRVKTVGQQQSKTVGEKVDNKALTNISYEVVDDSALIDDQQAPLVIYNDANGNHETKLNKKNIPLQSVENKLLSQRVTSKDEAQVGNFPSMVCAQPATSIINNCGVQQVERYYVEDDCCFPSSSISCTPNACIPSSAISCVSNPCLPSSAISCVSNSCFPSSTISCTPNSCFPSSTISCAPNPCFPSSTISCAPNPCFSSPTISCSSNPCVIQKPSSCLCVAQQQPQQQLLLCTNPNSAQNYICSSGCNVIQQASVPQQQYVCVESPPAPTYLCVPQAPVQQTANFVIQQPQIQAQPLQLIQAPQAQGGQYLKISSASPQVIQTIQGSDIQGLQPQIIQVPSQGFAASPQMLYQRPYDPVILPAQNQQFTFAQSPAISLSQPSYARQGRPGPRMFQHALVRTVAGHTGLPVPLSASGSSGVLQLMQPSTVGSYGRAPLATTARNLSTGGPQPSSSSPMLPLTPGGLLLPFQPSEPPKGMTQGPLSQPGGFQSNLVNFNKTRQQIQQRAQLLADLRQEHDNERLLLHTRSANAPRPSLPAVSNNAVRPTFNPSSSSSPGFLSNGLARSPGFSPSVPTSPPGFSSSLPQPPPAVIRSQTPYRTGNIFGTSSSSSSRSSASSTRPASAARPNNPGLIYSQPSFGGSDVSGPGNSYQPL